MISKVKLFAYELRHSYADKDSLKFRFIRNAFWTLSSSLISRLLTLISLLIAARILGQQEYGAFGIVRSTALTFVSFAGLGFGLTATRYIAGYIKTDLARVQKIISLTYVFSIASGLFFFLLFFFGAEKIAIQIMNQPELSAEVRWSSVILLFSTVTGAQTGILSGMEEFKNITFANLVSGIVSFFLITTLPLVIGIMGAILGLCASQVILFLVLQFKIRSRLKQIKLPLTISIRHVRDEMPLLWRFTLPAFLATFIPVVILWLANIFIIRKPDGLNEIAIIDISNQWKEVIMYLPSTIGTSILPILSGFSVDDSVKFKKVIKMYLLILVGISLPIILPAVVFSSKIIQLYGFSVSPENRWILILYCVSSLFVVLCSGFGQILISKSRMWEGLLLNTFWGVINFSLTVYLLSLNYGALGIAIAFLVSYAVYAVAMFLYAKRQV